jgi:hypothetical protein
MPKNELWKSQKRKEVYWIYTIKEASCAPAETQESWFDYSLGGLFVFDYIHYAADNNLP